METWPFLKDPLPHWSEDDVLLLTHSFIQVLNIHVLRAYVALNTIGDLRRESSRAEKVSIFMALTCPDQRHKR